MSLDFC